MSWYDKLTKLMGKKPDEYTLEYNKSILGLKDREASAKSIFRGYLSFPAEKAKAKKLGLI